MNAVGYCNLEPEKLMPGCLRIWMLDPLSTLRRTSSVLTLGQPAYKAQNRPSLLTFLIREQWGSVRHREMITFPAAAEVFVSNSTNYDIPHLHRCHFRQTRDNATLVVLAD